ncbi:MAG: hypothetical protein K9I71_02420 [Ignavibacteriales bacterium]|nr:hypothetical protein [Ignavibacteriales bacterium]MCF8314945.1 hypothetical protein [Ignavibacteriales bacterium]MCF8436106.1 hypothetical protein [Ignavibacteriales bacterium]
MKTVKFLLVLLVLVAIGCSESGITDPINEGSSTKTLKKEFIKLPTLDQSNDLNTEALFIAAKFIKGEIGGNITLNRTYYTESGIAKVKSKLDIPSDAFSGWQLIAYLISTEYAVVDFFPSMEFDKDLTLDLEFQNIDLSAVSSPSEIEFAYIDNSGTVQIAEYDEIEVDVEEGTLSVTGAKIGHFSRYGFIR